MTRDGPDFFAEHNQLRGETPGDLSCCIPCTWHEDAGPYTKTSAIHIMNMSSILGLGKEIDITFIIGVFVKRAGYARKVPKDDAT